MQITTDFQKKTWGFSSATTTQKLASMTLLPQGLQSEEHLTTQQRSQLGKFMLEFFSGHEKPALGRTDRVEHVIDTGEALPVKQRYYPMSPARLREVNEELDKMLELGVVEKSGSPWSSPIVLVDKPDGSKRFCVNFKVLNSVTKRDAYPLPYVTTILDRLRDAKFLSSLDIKSAYWQIPLSMDSREKTAFTVPGRGLYHFVTMPFGLHNAPATWQRFIDTVLGANLEPYVFVYLDDVVIVTPTFEKHLEVLKEVIKRLREAKLTLNKDKCKICRPELRYLGYVVDYRGLRVDTQKVEAILQIPVPTSQKEVRQFCGTASWYRRFISNFASRIYPLTNLLKRNQRFRWTEEAQTAFEDIKTCLVSAPILTCPDFNKPFIISCDASAKGLGSVLSQDTENGEAVVAYASRTLTKAEQKYSATERECLAVIWSIERFRPYVEGTQFKVITDHYSLLWLFNMKDPQGRLARWALRLQPYDFTLVHRKGKEHVVPDLLSRTIIEDKSTAEVLKVEECIVRPRLRTTDQWYEGMLTRVQRNADLYPLWKVEDGHLWKLLKDQRRLPDDQEEWKMVVPKDKREELLSQMHDRPTAGHLGSNKTFHRLQNQYYWPKMRQDVGRYVARCKICQQVKFDQNRPMGLSGVRRGVDQPWNMISADLIGPLPRSTSGFKYILVVVDTFTKFPILIPLRSASAKLVASHMEKDVFLMFGIPKYCVCDNGAEFIGKEFKNMMVAYKVKLLYNPSRHPQSNPTERVNRTIGTMLRAFVGENHRMWDRELPKLGFALRSARHEVTDYSPAYLTYGRELYVPELDTELNQNPEDVPDVGDVETYGAKLIGLKEIYKYVESRLKAAHEKNARRYNLRRREAEFKVGDKVWKKTYPQSDALKFYSAKLAPVYSGPFTISRKLSK